MNAVFITRIVAFLTVASLNAQSRKGATMNVRVNGTSKLGVAVAVLATGLSSAGALYAQCGIACPPFTPPTGPNLLTNPDFEIAGACPFTWWFQGNGNCGTNAAVQGWNIHSSNSGAAVVTTLMPTTLPLGGGTKMIHIITGGNEGGIWQQLPAGLTKVTASAWVFVRRGHVVMQSNGGNTGPSSWSTTTNQWEFLRVCTDGSVPVNMFIVYNEDPAGSDFFVDRVNVQVAN
jgi:hypothetical protein